MPYEENSRGKRGRDAGGAHSQGLSHPSSGKSNGSSVNTSQKIAGHGVGWVEMIDQSNMNGGNNNNAFVQQNLSGSMEGVVGLHAQGSVPNGLQF